LKLINRLLRNRDQRIRNEERARLRYLLARVMEENESPEVVLVLGMLLELIEKDE
jgi:hypothetical protein